LKKFVFIIIVFGLFSCEQKERKDVVQTIKKDSTFSEKLDALYSKVEPEIPFNLPPGFHLDTIDINDSKRNAETFIIQPISGFKYIDKVISKEILKQKKEFIKNVDEVLKEYEECITSVKSTFRVVPLSVYQDNKITSIKLDFGYYVCAGFHGYSTFESFNFDNKTLKRLTLYDYLNLKTEKDKNDLKLLIANTIDEKQHSHGKEIIMEFNLKNINFNIEKDTISFNFSDYEIGSYSEGRFQAKISKKILSNKIRKKYHSTYL